MKFFPDSGAKQREALTFIAHSTHSRRSASIGLRFAACTDGRNPKITPIAMDEKLRFAIREGGRTVGSGVVTKIIE